MDQKLNFLLRFYFIITQDGSKVKLLASFYYVFKQDGSKVILGAVCRTWGLRGQNENFQNFGGGNGMKVSKQFRGFPKSRGGGKLILGGGAFPPPSMQP